MVVTDDGISNVFIAAFPNAESPIAVGFPVISTVSSVSHAKNKSFTISAELSIFAVFRFLHPQKTPSSNVFTVDGITMLSNTDHANARSPMVVTDDGI